jgi:hypothetical protein
MVYRAAVPYPADAIVSHYASEFERLGWSPSTRQGTGQWAEFVDGTVAGDPSVRQRLLWWTDQQGRREPLLALRYEEFDGQTDNVLVVVRLLPMEPPESLGLRYEEGPD